MSDSDRRHHDSPLQLQVLEGPQAGQELDLDGPVVVGRDPEGAQLVIDDPEASRRHASLTPEGQSLSVEDLGSTNGTFVNGSRIAKERILIPGDRMMIGTTVLEVALAEPEPEAEAESEPEAAAEPPPPPTPGTGNGAVAAAKLVHARVVEHFTTILRAWSQRDLDTMRPHVSSDFLERARSALDGLERDFQVNCIEDMRLRDVVVEHPGDAVPAGPVRAYVAFDARDWVEDLRTREVVGGNATVLLAFIERWSFIPERRRGWVIDRVESEWTGPAEGLDQDD